MKYVVDISSQQAQKIKHFIERGGYANFAEFISTAIENQILIEKSESPVIDSFETQQTDNASLQVKTALADYELIRIRNHPKAAPMPTFQQLCYSLGETEEGKTWLWGQTNRILPVKIGLRVLQRLLGSGQWIDLEDYRETAADVAAEFGHILREYEARNNRIRDERISAGLPHNGRPKSKIRYKAHFLGYVRRDGKLDGAMPFLRFVNLESDGKGGVIIALAEPGLEFAQLENPVIDNHSFENSFTEQEVSFYLEHIVRNVKGESNAMKWLLSKLANGIARREAINAELKKEFGQTWKLSDAVTNTQRAGLMSRMFELGLIEKKKRGIEVFFSVSDRGKIFLRNIDRN